MVSNVSADILSDNYGRSDRPGAPSHLCRWAGSLSGGALPQTTRLLYSQPRGTTPHQPEVPNKPQSCTFCPHLRHLDQGDLNVTAKLKDFRWKCKVLPLICISSPSLQQVDKCPLLGLELVEGPPGQNMDARRLLWGLLRDLLSTRTILLIRLKRQWSLLPHAGKERPRVGQKDQRKVKIMGSCLEWSVSCKFLSMLLLKSQGGFSNEEYVGTRLWPGKMLRWCWWQAVSPLGRWWRWLLGTSLTTQQPGPLQPN